VFSLTWGICFSLKANPNGSKNIAFWHVFGTGGTPASVHMLFEQEPSLLKIEFWHSENLFGAALSHAVCF